MGLGWRCSSENNSHNKPKELIEAAARQRNIEEKKLNLFNDFLNNL